MTNTIHTYTKLKITKRPYIKIGVDYAFLVYGLVFFYVKGLI